MTRVETFTLLVFYLAMMLLASSLAGCASPPAGGQPAKWQPCGAMKTCIEVTPGPAKANHKVSNQI